MLLKRSDARTVMEDNCLLLVLGHQLQVQADCGANIYVMLKALASRLAPF